jgi:hypothetical protein
LLSLVKVKIQKIQKICSGGVDITDSTGKANAFNKCFSGIGEKISESDEIRTTDYKEHLTDPAPNSIPLEFGEISHAEFITLIKNLESKPSVDIDGISNKLLKFLRFELAVPCGRQEHL